MKKIISMMLIALMALGLVACADATSKDVVNES